MLYFLLLLYCIGAVITFGITCAFFYNQFYSIYNSWILFAINLFMCITAMFVWPTFFVVFGVMHKFKYGIRFTWHPDYIAKWFKVGDVVRVIKTDKCPIKAQVHKELITEGLITEIVIDPYRQIMAPYKNKKTILSYDGMPVKIWGDYYLLRKANARETFLYHLHGPGHYDESI